MKNEKEMFGATIEDMKAIREKQGHDELRMATDDIVSTYGYCDSPFSQRTVEGVRQSLNRAKYWLTESVDDKQCLFERLEGEAMSLLSEAQWMIEMDCKIDAKAYMEEAVKKIESVCFS